MSIASTGALRFLPDAWSVSESHLSSLELRLQAACRSQGTLGEASSYHLSTGGKRLRGRISAAVGLALELPPEQFLPAATAVELLHGASLVHDDLQDGDQRRRGCEAVWSRYGRDVALLLGDAWIASSFCEATRAPEGRARELVAAITRSIHGLAEGQCVDTRPPKPVDWTTTAYEAMARFKTGKLFALAGEMPLLVKGSVPELRVALNEALELLGVAYQIRDDVADFLGRKGRERASDLRSWRMSSVLVHYVRRRGAVVAAGNDSDVAGSPLTDSTLERRIKDVVASGALTAVLLQQRSLLRRANQQGRILPRSVARVIAALGREIERSSFDMYVELTANDRSIQPGDKLAATPSQRPAPLARQRLHAVHHLSA